MKKVLVLLVVIMCLLMISPLSTAYAKGFENETEEAVTDNTTDTTQEPSEDDTAAADSSAVVAAPEETTETAANDEVLDVAPLELYLDAGSYVSTTAFASDHYMVGLFSTITQGFSVGNWDLQDAQMTLSFSTTQLVDETMSDITLSINGVRFYSERVPVTDGARRELTVKVPIEHIKEGYNIISIEGYIRTYNGLPCVDDVTTANWMNVFKESYIDVSYHPLDVCTNIDEFYTCFTSIDSLENSNSAVIVPTGYDTDEIDAALTVLSGISKSAGQNYNNIELLSADSLSNVKKKYVIYIAKPDKLPSNLKSAITTSDISGSISGLYLIQGDTNILVVAGMNEASLNNASALISNALTMHQLKGAEKIVAEDEDVFMRKEGILQYTKITETGTYFDGPFRQKYDYYIDFENNRKLAYGSELDLYFRYSENLDFDRSLVSVYVNNIPIGSQKLSQAKAEGDNIVLTIPTDIEVTGSFVMTIAFDLEIKDLWCTLRQSETPWAYVSSDTTLKLNSVDVPYYLFENYPYPFITEGEFNDTVLVLPDDNTEMDLNLMGKMILTLGQYIKYNTGEFSVVRASATGELEGKNVIALGTFNNNPFISELNDDLFFRFYDNGAGIMSNEKLLIEQSYSTKLATAQMIQSPYSDVKNAILIIASANKTDLKNALAYFADASELLELYGDGFVADADDVFPYRFKEENAKEDTVYEDFNERKDVMNLIYIGGAVLAILLVAVIFIIIRYRRKKENEEK